MNLLEGHRQEKLDRLARAADQLREKYGFGKVRHITFAADGTELIDGKEPVEKSLRDGMSIADRKATRDA